MADIIIVLILIVIAVFAIKQTKKHMHGESPCCGGGSGTVKKIKEKQMKIVKIDKKIGFFTVQSTKAENIDKEKV